MKDLCREYLIEGERAGARYAFNIPREAMRNASGLVLSNLTGSSIDFKDYREYQPGDNLRNIDWSVYGRSDKLIVKMFREEVNPHLDLVLDTSRSMALADTEKERALLGVAGMLASAAINARCSHTAWKISDGFQRVVNGNEIPSAWDGLEIDNAATAAEAFAIMPPRWRKHGIRVMISDLLWIDDPLTVLRPFVDGASAAIIVQLLAKVDIDPVQRGNMKLSDVETGAEMDVFVDAVTEERYVQALMRHQQNWEQACKQVGAQMVTLVAEEVVAGWRLDELEKIQVLGVI